MKYSDYFEYVCNFFLFYFEKFSRMQKKNESHDFFLVFLLDSERGIKITNYKDFFKFFIRLCVFGGGGVVK